MKNFVQLLKPSFLFIALATFSYQTSASEPIKLGKRTRACTKKSCDQNKPSELKKEKCSSSKIDTTHALPLDEKAVDKNQISPEDFYFLNLFFRLN